jgi:hypothetical protein
MMVMRKRFCVQTIFIAICGGTTLLGCALPGLIDDEQIRIADIIMHAQCEIANAQHKYQKNLNEKWQGAFSLDLVVERNQDGGASADWSIPYRINETLKLGPSFSLNNKVRRESNLKFDVIPQDEKNCKNYRTEGVGPYRLHGDFGLKDYLEKLFAKSSPQDFESFEYTVEFAIKSEAGVKPGFRIINLEGVTGLSGDKSDSHQLNVAFTRKSPLPKVQIVCVANMKTDMLCDKKAIKKIQKEISPDVPKIRFRALTGETIERAPPDPATRERLFQQLDILRLRSRLR